MHIKYFNFIDKTTTQYYCILSPLFWPPLLLLKTTPDPEQMPAPPSCRHTTMMLLITTLHPAPTSSMGGVCVFVGKLTPCFLPASGKCQASVCGRKCHNVLWGQLNEIKSRGLLPVMSQGSWEGRCSSRGRHEREVPNQTDTQCKNVA